MTTFRGSGSPTTGGALFSQADLDNAIAAVNEAAAEAEVSADGATASAAAAATSESNAAGSESAAATSESNAAASESAASASETNAAASETAAGISETNAAASEAAAAASEAAAAASADAAAGAGGAAKDFMINGTFAVNQRGDQTGLTDGAWPFDRWAWREVSGAIISSSTEEGNPGEDTGGTHPITYGKLITTTADAAVAATDINYLETALDVEDVLPLYDEDIILTFRVRSNFAGTFCVAIGNDAQDAFYIEEVAISAANTWEKKEVTLTLDTTQGTAWPTTKGSVGLYLQFILNAGTNFHGTSGQWNASKQSTSNQDNYVGAVSRTFELSAIKLEKGSTSTAYVTRHFSEEFNRCLRYYQQSYNFGVNPGTATSNGAARQRVARSSAAIYAHTPLYPMQSIPTIELYSPNDGASGNIYNLSAASNRAVSTITYTGDSEIGLITLSISVSDTNAIEWQWTATAEIF